MRVVDKVLAEESDQIDSIVRRYATDYDEREDLRQQIYLHFLEMEADVLPERFSAWVGRVARNVCITEYRKSQREGNEYWTEAFQDGAADPADIYLRDKMVARLHELINKLDKHMTDAIPVVLGEVTAIEQAEAVGCSVDAMRKRAQRLREWLLSAS